jgi:hypothetical protein
MRPSSFLVSIAAAAIFVSSALAEDHPCVQPQDPFVVALCSDPELRAVADQQRDEMMALWNRLSPQEQDKFRKDQLAWRDITAHRCRVDRPTPLPLSDETKICLGQAEAGRIAYLQHYGQTGAPTALHPNATAQGTPAASTPVEGRAYRDGLRDRAAWEQWFNGLQGDYKSGAFFWSSQRSLPKPGSCKQMDDDFDAGCTAAKTRLSASDTRRKIEPDYKAGWNAWNPSDLTTSAAPAPAPQPIAKRTPQPPHEESALATPSTPNAISNPPTTVGAEGAPLETPSPQTYPGQGSATIEFEGNGRLNTSPFHMAGPWEISWRGDLSIAIHETTGKIFDYFRGHDSNSFVPKGGNFYLEVADFRDEKWSVTIHPIERQDLEPTAGPLPSAGSTAATTAPSAASPPAPGPPNVTDFKRVGRSHKSDAYDEARYGITGPNAKRHTCREEELL